MEDVIYSQNPRPVGLPVTFVLRKRSLDISRMGDATSVPLAKVREIRLTFEPTSFAHHRLKTELKLSEGGKISFTSVSYRSLVQSDRQDEAYGRFVRELLLRTQAANRDVRLVAGRNHFAWYATILVALTMMGAIAVFMIQAVSAGETTALAVGLFIFAVGAWQITPLIRLNRPATIDAQSPPPWLVP